MSAAATILDYRVDSYEPVAETPVDLCVGVRDALVGCRSSMLPFGAGP